MDPFKGSIYSFSVTKKMCSCYGLKVCRFLNICLIMLIILIIVWRNILYDVYVSGLKKI